MRWQLAYAPSEDDEIVLFAVGQDTTDENALVAVEGFLFVATVSAADKESVVEIDGLTALPEYRNGGLLVDTGVIRPRAPIDPARPHEVASEFIVEWRALTGTLSLTR